MVVGTFVVEGFRVPDAAVGVDHEGLIRRQDFVLADVAKLGGAVPVRRLHPDDLPVYMPLVHLNHIAGLRKRRGVLIYVRNGYVDRRTREKQKKQKLNSDQKWKQLKTDIVKVWDSR